MLRRSLLAAPDCSCSPRRRRAPSGRPSSRSTSSSVSRPAAPPTSRRDWPARRSSAAPDTIVVVDNKSGALGFIALKAVANAAPDGYTVGIGIMGSLAVGAGGAGLADPARPRQGAPADLQSGRRADGADRAAQRALQDRRRADRLRQGQSRQGELRLDRQRLDQPARRRAVRRGSRRAEAAARAVSRRRAGDRRRGGGPDRHVLRQRLGDRRPDPQRSGARAAASRRASQSDGARPAVADQGHADVQHQQLVRTGRTGRTAAGDRRPLRKLFLDAINDPATKPLLDSRGLVTFRRTAPPSRRDPEGPRALGEGGESRAISARE